MMAHSSSLSFQCGTLTLLILPAVTLLVYLLTVFPQHPASLSIQPSLSSLPKDSRSWQIYAEDHFQGGAYVTFPYGRVGRLLSAYTLHSLTDCFLVLGTILVDGSGGRDTSESCVVFVGTMSTYERLLRLSSSMVFPYLLSFGRKLRHSWPQMATVYFSTVRANNACFLGQVFTHKFDHTDLYGRGYSDAPKMTYDTTLYVTQLALLMQYLGWDKTHVVGLSMVCLLYLYCRRVFKGEINVQGGGIGAAFCDQFPHLVSGKLALLASTGIVEVRLHPP